MTRSIELPLWLLILILLFAAVTFASHFLFPSVRWFFRRRMERVVSRLNERLERPIQPFKLARRYDMIQRLIYDPAVAQAISEHAREENVPEAVAFQRARGYAREIVPSFSASLYFGFAIKIARWLSQKLYTVHLDETNDAALRAIDADATVVFVMNHRSNMDYVLVTYLAADRSALSYAVGEWARVWPLSWLIKTMGAFFIRRKSRNALYRRVLARYVQLATKGGVTQAIFPEGGLSLDGAMGTAKLGLLSYIVSDFNPETDPDVVFVPVALNYDRVLEDRVLINAAAKGERKFRASVVGFIWFVIRYVWPLSWLIKTMGAFFIRRKSRNALYRRVLARYVQLATKGGVTQAIFPEGGLSLDGAMGTAKLGLLSYIVSDFNPETDPDVVFVPVALNYDRVLEDRVLINAAAKGERKFRASVVGFIWFVIRYVWRRWRKTAVRFGHAAVGYGTPFSLKDYLKDVEGDQIKAVGYAVRSHVKSAIPALPVSTVCFALQEFTHVPTLAELTKATAGLMEIHGHASMTGPVAVVEEALASLTSRRIVEITPNGIEIIEENRPLLAYYANSVAHLFANDV